MRLYSVLGKRTGHEQPLPRAAEERPAQVPIARTVDATPEQRTIANGNIDARAEPGLRSIIAVEPGFDVNQFLEGAQAAYRMTLEAFWKGDADTLADLAEDDVRTAFVEAIAAREAAGETLDNRLVTIERADIAAITRNEAGEVIAGSLTDAVETHDIWTFVRTLKSAGPNWKLADTDEA